MYLFFCIMKKMHIFVSYYNKQFNMKYNGLQSFVEKLKEEQEIMEITASVSPHLEITEIADRMIKNNGKALLFTNNGSNFPLLINAFASEKRMAMSLGVSKLDDIADDVQSIFTKFTTPRKGIFQKLKLLPELKKMSEWLPRKKSGKGKCQEIVMQSPDLSKLPVLTCWPYDGGPFITLPVVHTTDPNTGIRNTGMYRMQVMDEKTTGMHWHLHKGSAKHYREYQKLQRKMPVSVILGGDPVYTYVATAPLPEQFDEYILAGFLRKKPVKLVKCLTNDLWVPEDADFVIEGYVDPMEELVLEGPFGDHTGFYSLADYYPKFHVTAITHRKNAVYPATIVGVPPQEDVFLGNATNRIFIAPIRLSMLPELTDMHLPAEGVFHNIALISFKKEYPGHAQKVISSLWGAGQMMLNKIMIVTDNDIPLHFNYKNLLKEGIRDFNPSNDVILTTGPADVLDHAARTFAYSGKLGLDFTRKGEKNDRKENESLISIPEELSNYLGIKTINNSLITDGIPVIILGVEKKISGNMASWAKSLLEKHPIHGLKALLLFDDFTDLNDYSLLAWLAGNHIDPLTDAFVFAGTNNSSVLVLDASCKTGKTDGFKRDWPNVVSSLPETIALVNARWNEYGFEGMATSPSLRVKNLILSEGAVHIES